jgi:EAL domain-containing protein (putative c-di-GMP-specific phosphodiesterase class I)
VFNDAMTAAAKDGLVIDGALRGAIAAGEFYLVYQAITNAHTGKLTKVEALLRWQLAAGAGAAGPLHPGGGRQRHDYRARHLGAGAGLPPDGRVEAERARRRDHQHQCLGLAAGGPDFVTLVSQALMRNKLAPHQLELELTERVLIEDAANVQAVLAQLRALGVGISLDDFGTGYSSLSYLTQFHLNTLKIDRAFVMDIEHSERSNSLGMPSSRWGTAWGCNWWRKAWRRPGRRPSQKMGCHYLQGYHIARPAAPDELLRFADERAGAGAAHRLRYLAVGTFCAASSAVRIQMRSILPMLSTCS